MIPESKVSEFKVAIAGHEWRFKYLRGSGCMEATAVEEESPQHALNSIIEQRIKDKDFLERQLSESRRQLAESDYLRTQEAKMADSHTRDIIDYVHCVAQHTRALKQLQRTDMSHSVDVVRKSHRVVLPPGRLCSWGFGWVVLAPHLDVVTDTTVVTRTVAPTPTPASVRVDSRSSSSSIRGPFNFIVAVPGTDRFVTGMVTQIWHSFSMTDNGARQEEQQGNMVYVECWPTHLDDSTTPILTYLQSVHEAVLCGFDISTPDLYIVRPIPYRLPFVSGVDLGELWAWLSPTFGLWVQTKDLHAPRSVYAGQLVSCLGPLVRHGPRSVCFVNSQDRRVYVARLGDAAMDLWQYKSSRSARDENLHASDPDSERVLSISLYDDTMCAVSGVLHLTRDSHTLVYLSEDGKSVVAHPGGKVLARSEKPLSTVCAASTNHMFVKYEKGFSYLHVNLTGV